MNKTVSIIITFGLVVGIGIILMGSSDNNLTQNNVEIIDGVQYVTINAGGGYSPETSNAKADIPTKLIIKSNGTFDCSASLVIRSINFQKILPQIGETEIDLGIPKIGEPLRGTCSMGMYNFVINFS